MITRIGCIAILSMLMPAYSSGQSVLSNGERIRIHRADGTEVTGILQSVSAQELQLVGDGQASEFVITRAEVGRIQRSLGPRRNFGRNFMLSIAASSLGLGVISAVSWSPCTETGFLACFLEPSSRSEALSWGLAGGAIIGVPIGIIVGLASKSERWQTVVLPGQGQSAISIEPILGRQFGLTASLTFGGH